MVKLNQIKAGRGLLGWHQKDLARQADVSELSIINIENGKTSPQKNTLDKILAAFELAGVSFTDNGVDMKDNSYTVLTGRDWYARTLEDTEQTLERLPEEEREWFIFYCGERHSPPAVIEKLKTLKQKGISYKAMIKEGDTHIYSDFSNYRFLPTAFFDEDRFISCYGDKVSIAEQTYEQSSVYIFRNAELATFIKNIARLLWAVLPEPKKTTAEKIF